MAGIATRDQAENGEHGREGAEPGNPERLDVGHASDGDVANDHPRQERARRQQHARDQRHEIGAHARTEDPARGYWVSFHSSYQAIWIASSFGSFDIFGS